MLKELLETLKWRIRYLLARYALRRGSRPRGRRIWRWVLGGAGGLVLAFVALFVWYTYDMPDMDQLKTPERRPSVTVTAADGTIVTTYGDLFAGPVELDDLPPYLIQAIVATEDRRFFEHGGYDPMAILRAAYINLRAGAVRQGGSTITQQLAKNLFLSPNRTIRRKVQELLLAFQLEAAFTKQELFTVYVNLLYLGAGTFGVEAAARRYFGVSASKLTIHEAAVLAGLIRAPSRYAPTHNLEGATKRARVVLARMVAEKHLTREQADAAAAVPLRIATTGGKGSGRYFGDWVMERAAGFIAQVPHNLIIETTLDAKSQLAAETRLTATLDARGEALNAGQGALLALAPDGAVRAMVGGRAYNKSQFNRATQAMRQPGSAFKLFVYLAAMEAGRSPDDTMTDAPVTIEKWSPRNYSGTYRGTVTLRDAFATSINSVAVQVSEEIGRDKVIETARRLGITSPLKAHPSLALGASEVTLLELTAAYATLANRGRGVLPYAIREIRDTQGQVYYRRTGAAPIQVVEPEHVDAMRDLLATTVARGTGRRAALPRPVAGKTGTSQEWRDAWFVGFTPDLVVGVWIGNDDGAPMNRVAGGSLPAGIWKRFVADTPAGPTLAWDRVAGGSFFSRLAGAFSGLFGSSSPETSSNPDAAPAKKVLATQPATRPSASRRKPRRPRKREEEVDTGDYQP